MTANRKFDSRPASPKLEIVHNSQAVPTKTRLVNEKLQHANDLDAALRLAAQHHRGALEFTGEQSTDLIKILKQKAMDELELGDGRKIESVRVERKLDGSVSIFFGI
jgi:hypothetical protein